jgi:hypothetical protein
MNWRHWWPIAFIGAGPLSGCYYDPATGYSYPYPPQGYAAPPPGYGGPPAPDYGAPPQGYAAPPAGYDAPPPQGYAAPPAGYGTPPAAGYGAPTPSGPGITRTEYVQRAVARAERQGRDPQTAAQRAGAVFDQIDINHAGVITRDQIRAWRAAHAPARNPGPPPPPNPG